MIVNPFFPKGSLTTVLEREDCHRIHYHALRAAMRGIHPRAVPESLPLGALQVRARLAGAEVYLFHPTEIERLFAGVTLAVYRAVRTLYCSRLGRSIKMVWQILCAMASTAGAVPISYEAIWALCLHLEERRRASLAVHLDRGQDIWWIEQTTPDIYIQEGTAPGYQPTITWCVQTGEPRVLAFRIAPQSVACESAALALYDAITVQRRPLPRVATGLTWHMPQEIISTVTLSPSCLAACARADIKVRKTTAALPFVQTVRETWERGVAGRVLRSSHCAALLDNYLNKTYGYGTLREREQREREYTALVGYNQDPAWQFPLLRELLPLAASVITAEAAIPFDGLHYTHELLAYWTGYPVTVRRSVHMESAAWVYLDGEVLCHAHARELRRRDGSYRHFRSER